MGSLIQKHPRMKFNLCKVQPCNWEGIEDVKQGVRLNRDNKTVLLWESPPWYLEYEYLYDKFFQRFPKTDGIRSVTIDKSPAYFTTHFMPAKVKELMPDTKIVFSVCDPAERLVSEFYHHHREQGLIDTFENFFTERNVKPPKDLDEYAAIVNQTEPTCKDNQENCAWLANYFMDNGWFIRHMQRWWQYFDPKDTLTISMNDPIALNAKKLVSFAGLSLYEYPWDELDQKRAFSNPSYAGRERGWTEFPTAMQVFSERYLETNRELAAAIGMDFPLNWKSTQVASASQKKN